jgi:hypothetical protein
MAFVFMDTQLSLHEKINLQAFEGSGLVPYSTCSMLN